MKKRKIIEKKEGEKEEIKMVVSQTKCILFYTRKRNAVIIVSVDLVGRRCWRCCVVIITADVQNSWREKKTKLLKNITFLALSDW